MSKQGCGVRKSSHLGKGVSDCGVVVRDGQCIVIVPGLKKGAFFIGAKYGKGFVSCRRSGGVGWSAPGAIRVEGGSIGLQWGGTETAVRSLLAGLRSHCTESVVFCPQRDATSETGGAEERIAIPAGLAANS